MRYRKILPGSVALALAAASAAGVTFVAVDPPRPKRPAEPEPSRDPGPGPVIVIEDNHPAAQSEVIGGQAARLPWWKRSPEGDEARGIRKMEAAAKKRRRKGEKLRRIAAAQGRAHAEG